jgi:hypothetical protein
VLRHVSREATGIGLPIAWNGQGFITPADVANDPRIVAVAQIQTGDDPGKDRAWRAVRPFAFRMAMAPA